MGNIIDRLLTGFLFVLIATIAGLLIFVMSPHPDSSVPSVEVMVAEAVPAVIPLPTGEEILAEAGGAAVTIIWTDEEINCGVAVTGKGGCYRSDNPGAIYVSPGMGHESMKYVVLHEYAHFLGYGECDADRFALDNGALEGLAYYLPRCAPGEDAPGVAATHQH